MNDGGIASCLDARTGTVIWQQRLGGTYSASPVFADGRIYFLAEQGVTTVIAPGKEFRRLATNALDGGLLASMAVSGGSLFLRTDSVTCTVFWRHLDDETTTLFLSVAMLASHWPSAAFAQATTGQKPFEPQVGQAGKDVVWVPTPQAVVDKMLDMAKVTKTDFVMDLGSGDGRTVITAAKRGARAMGIEYNPDMVELSKRNAEGSRRDRSRHVREGRPVRDRSLEGAT